jgi:hypothetical protein
MLQAGFAALLPIRPACRSRPSDQIGRMDQHILIMQLFWITSLQNLYVNHTQFTIIVFNLKQPNLQGTYRKVKE